MDGSSCDYSSYASTLILVIIIQQEASASVSTTLVCYSIVIAIDINTWNLYNNFIWKCCNLSSNLCWSLFQFILATDDIEGTLRIIQLLQLLF